MNNVKKRNFESLAKAAKAAGLIGLGELTDIGTSVALGTVKTLQESTWEKKAILSGIIGNIATHALDMDLPFSGVGMNSLVGIDAFIDNASDIAIGVAGTSLAYKAANNIQQIHNSKKSVEDIMAELGIAFDDEDEQENLEPVRNPNGIFSSMSPETLRALREARNNVIQENKNETIESTNDEINPEDEEKAERELLKKLLKKYGTETIL